MNIPVLPPDVNESNINFTVNSKGAIRFGLSALKNMGEGSGDDIINERKANGPFASIFDLTSRVNLKAVNKKALEALVMGGEWIVLKAHTGLSILLQRIGTNHLLNMRFDMGSQCRPRPAKPNSPCLVIRQPTCFRNLHCRRYLIGP